MPVTVGIYGTLIGLFSKKNTGRRKSCAAEFAYFVDETKDEPNFR